MTSDKPPPSTVVVLVRHGHTPTTGDVLPGRTPGLHLSQTGQRQAKAAAATISSLFAPNSDRRPMTLYCSPMERTVETAKILGDNLGLTATEEPGLIEADFGSWTGSKLADLHKLPEWEQVQRNPSGFRFPDGESFPEMQLRMTSTLRDLGERHVGQTILAVSHADMIKTAVVDAVGSHLDLFQRIAIHPCSVSTIEYTQNGPRILGVNVSQGSVAQSG